MKSAIITIIGTMLIVAATAGVIYTVEHPGYPILPTIPRPYLTSTPTADKQVWVLRNKKTITNITRLHIQDIQNMIVWKSLLIIPDFSSRLLKKVNFTNGTVTTLFTVPAKDTQSTVTAPQIIGNSLFFSVWHEGSGFTREGATYAMKLDTETTARKVLDFPGTIQKLGSRYFIVRDDAGDTCGGRTTYAAVDIEKATATYIAETFGGCLKGEKFITLDSNDRMNLAYEDGQTGPGGAFFDGLATYKYVLAIHLSDPSQKDRLIAEQEMPAEITDIQYDKNNNQLILVGKSVYAFDLATDTLRNIADLPDSWDTTWIDSHNGPHYCIVRPNKQKTLALSDNKEYAEQVEVNIDTNSLVTDSTFCPKEKVFNPSQSAPPAAEKPTTEIIKDHKLPASYEIVKAK